jgi:hypothetical protein
MVSPATVPFVAPSGSSFLSTRRSHISGARTHAMFQNRHRIEDTKARDDLL